MILLLMMIIPTAVATPVPVPMLHRQIWVAAMNQHYLSYWLGALLYDCDRLVALIRVITAAARR
jgi:hypothetical protein